MIHTIIVEDDPMVAQINRQYLHRMGDFHIDAQFDTGRGALDYLRAHAVDLAILDVYMPGMNGVELLRQMRAEGIRCSVIMVTAATEMGLVADVLRLGVVDYLIKPYSLPRFQEAVTKYLTKFNLLRGSRVADQSVVDKLLGREPDAQEEDMRKGLNQKTLSHLCAYLVQHADEKHTCESISAACGLSKVTVRRYLNYMIETGKLVSELDYETGGRPRVLYCLKNRDFQPEDCMFPR